MEGIDASLLDFAFPEYIFNPFSLLMMESMYRSCLNSRSGHVRLLISHRLLDSGGNAVENDDISEVVFDIRRVQDSPWDEIAGGALSGSRSDFSNTFTRTQ